jgi:hypothetical protein
VPVVLTEKLHEPFCASVPPANVTAPAPETAVIVPAPQDPISPFGDATTKPGGKLSVNAAPVSATLPTAVLLIVNVSVLFAFKAIDVGANAFVIDGGGATLRFAVAELPVPPFVEVTLPVLFVNWPEATPVTFTMIVQLALTATAPPVSVMLTEPATAVAVPAQLFVNPLGVATTSPVGSVSANATPASATAFAAGFVIVNVKEVVPFRGIFPAPKALAIEGGASTETLAEAVPPVPPSVDVTALVVLFFAPAVVPVTFKWKLQLLAAGRVPPDRLIALLPAVAVIVPVPQLPTNPLGVEMISPAGSVSANPIPEKLCVVLLFWMLKSKSIVPFSEILATGGTPNCLLSTGAEITVRLAFEVFPVPPSIEVTCTLLFATPATVPVTFTVIVHEALVASVPPDRLTEPDPAAAVAVPLQVLFRLLGVATTRVPCVCGNVSVNPMPVRATPVLGFVILKVSEVLPF